MNEAIGGLFVVVFLIVIVTIVIAIYTQSRNELNATYERLARRVKGRCNVSGLWGTPSVSFVYRNFHALLDIHSTGGEDAKLYTQLHITWPDKSFRCEVYPDGVLSRIGKFFGMQDVEIGSPRFDKDYVIKGNSVRELREFLSAEVQQRIDRLRALSPSVGIYVSVSGGQLLVKKPGEIREYDLLERFVLLGLELFDEATQASAEGIEFVEARPEAKLSLKEAICQVCGEPVKLDAVFCRSCKTPHHKDCWEYYGACSTYGCGQRRYLVQRAR